MQLRNWNPTWKLLFLLSISLTCIQSHMLHYMHLKKFLTAVAFARALGKRPTILPIPIPIPIPIAQNEVIKLPVGGNTAKTTILDGSRGSSQAEVLAQVLSGASNYGGSNKFGYALPSTNHPSVINLSQLKGSESSLVNSLASVLGNGGQTKVLILGGQNPGGSLATSPSVIHLNSVPGLSHSNAMGIGGSGLNFGGLNGMDVGLNGISGLNLGNGFSGSGLASSLTNAFHLPHNAYSDTSRKRFPIQHHGRNVRNGISSHQNGGNSRPCEPHCQKNYSSPNHGQTRVRNTLQNSTPLSLKFTYNP